MSILLVTKNRYDSMRRALRTMLAKAHADNRDLAVANDALRELVNDQKNEIDKLNRQLDALTIAFAKPDTRKDIALQIANSEIQIWVAGSDNPPTVHTSIVQLWNRYKNLRRRDLDDLPAGMVGIAITPREVPAEVNPEMIRYLTNGATKHDEETATTTVDQIPVIDIATGEISIREELDCD